MIHETDPTADRLREILDADEGVDRALMVSELADELDRHARARRDRAAEAHPAEALRRIAWELDAAAGLDSDADGPDPVAQELREIAVAVEEAAAHGLTKARAVRAETARQTDEIALRALETVLDVEGLGRDASHLLDGPDEDDRRVVHRDRIRVDRLRRALVSVDELGRHAHLIRKGLALGPLRDDPDARIRSLESVLRRVIVALDHAATLAGMIDDLVDGGPGTGFLEELREILDRTFGLAAAAAPGPVSLDGPYAYRTVSSVVELDEAARHLDTIGRLRFAPPPGPALPQEVAADVRAARTASIHASMALARLGANARPHELPDAWAALDEVAALLTQAIDDAFTREADPPVELLDRARDLTLQAGGDPQRWTPPGDAGNGSNDPG